MLAKLLHDVGGQLPKGKILLSTKNHGGVKLMLPKNLRQVQCCLQEICCKIQAEKTFLILHWSASWKKRVTGASRLMTKRGDDTNISVLIWWETEAVPHISVLWTFYRCHLFYLLYLYVILCDLANTYLLLLSFLSLSS